MHCVYMLTFAFKQEFFIEHTAQHQDDPLAHLHSAASTTTNNANNNSTTSSSSSSGRYDSATAATTAANESTAAEYSWNEGYVIAGGSGRSSSYTNTSSSSSYTNSISTSGAAMLPTVYFPAELAHRILFIGKAVQVSAYSVMQQQ
jgi:hypothetical protein